MKRLPPLHFSTPEQASDFRCASFWIAAALASGLALNCLVIARAMAGLFFF